MLKEPFGINGLTETPIKDMNPTGKSTAISVTVVREPGVSTGITGLQLRTPWKASWEHHSTMISKGHQLGTHFIERHEPLGQPMWIFPVWPSATKTDHSKKISHRNFFFRPFHPITQWIYTFSRCFDKDRASRYTWENVSILYRISDWFESIIFGTKFMGNWAKKKRRGFRTGPSELV